MGQDFFLCDGAFSLIQQVPQLHHEFSGCHHINNYFFIWVLNSIPLTKKRSKQACALPYLYIVLPNHRYSQRTCEASLLRINVQAMLLQRANLNVVSGLAAD